MQLPKHIAIIMDGNGRWAENKGQVRVFGHENAVKSVKEVVEACLELSVPYLTLYAFSKENFQRPEFEVSKIMEIMAKTIQQEKKNLSEQGIKVSVIGDITKLPKNLQEEINELNNIHLHNVKLYLTLAISYSGRWEIVEATKNIVKDVMNGIIKYEEIDELSFAKYLKTKTIPDPDLVIRTSQEYRISNFLLWQMAYAELLFASSILWPDFTKKDLYDAIDVYKQRKRRFGKIGTNPIT